MNKKRIKKLASPLGSPVAVAGKGAIGKNPGGWGVGAPKSQPASGTAPSANPFIIPKGAGLNVISQTFPNNYYVEWNLSTWRNACDQAIRMGYTMSLATLYSWTFECSPFVQSLFRALSSPIGKTAFMIVDQKGDELPEWTAELCNKPWQKELRKEIAMSHFWGFAGINFDPINEKVYKYPQQEIDCINRMLRQSTYSFYDGVNFSDHDNLLFVQPSTSYESFLGWMQPITRSFIQMNVNKNSWISAGRRLAFPLMTVGYPQDDGSIGQDGQAYNEYKIQAEDVVANADPTKGLVYPYTLDSKGNIVKSLEIEYEKTGTSASMHKIFSDFNDAEKDEIREMIFGGTLTSSVGNSGSRALGEVHQDKFNTVVEEMIEFIESYLNSEYIEKISKFYSNFPKGIHFAANKAKQFSLEDIKSISAVLSQSGKKLTDNFFEAQGIAKEFFEDAPQQDLTEPIETMGSKKKF